MVLTYPSAHVLFIFVIFALHSNQQSGQMRELHRSVTFAETCSIFLGGADFRGSEWLQVMYAELREATVKGASRFECDYGTSLLALRGVLSVGLSTRSIPSQFFKCGHRSRRHCH
uniref:Putative secreted protein ovary overexpressed n=1 Tax=Rhipicephalus microplus TaxID=6941 RepID=A0A6M2D9D5_RHIMP